MISVQLLLILITLCVCFETRQSPCITPSGKSGNCVHVSECSSLRKMLLHPKPKEQDLMRNSICEPDNGPDRMCCPTETCTAPDGTEGTCTSLTSCKHYVQMSSETTQNMSKTLCNGNDVCCSKEIDFWSKFFNSISTKSNYNEKNKAVKCQPTALPPSTDCCGNDHGNNADKIIGGNITAIDEFSWLALIEYETEESTKLLCGGVLISGQFVLTASHCIEGSILNVGNPVGVRLGEYDKSKPGKDCVPTPWDDEDCTDGAVTVPIEEILSQSDENSRIALIKLVHIVQFTDFIQPICLPTVDFTTNSSASVQLYAGGWGATGSSRSSNIKNKVRLPYVSNEICQSFYDNSINRRQVQFWDRHICAGGERGRDTCRRDSGGPLMRLVKGKYEVVGIIDLGIEDCGQQEVPGVYAKVFHYLPWIRSQIIVNSSRNDTNIV